MSEWNKASSILVTCPPLLSPFLAKEVQELGLPVKEELLLGVRSQGTLIDCMRLCLGLRTGHRVLFQISSFKATNPDWLYRNARKIDWERYLPLDGYFSVSATLNTQAVNNSMFAALKLKDAIVDRMRNDNGVRPDSGKENKGAALFLHWDQETVTLYLDCSGKPLAQRGYRLLPHTAPMQETLAAAVLFAANYQGKTFINPMCGSGTLAIEAALMALGRSPGTLRDYFSFKYLAGYDPQIWEELQEDAMLNCKQEISGQIIATDIDPKAVEITKQNAKRAKVEEYIECACCDFRETKLPHNETGLIVLNPEYGKRLGLEQALEQQYVAIGNFFKQQCSGYTGGIFTGNLNLAKKVGLRTSRRVPFRNARLDCRLLLYELYAGSRKAQKQ